MLNKLSTMVRGELLQPQHVRTTVQAQQRAAYPCLKLCPRQDVRHAHPLPQQLCHHHLILLELLALLGPRIPRALAHQPQGGCLQPAPAPSAKLTVTEMYCQPSTLPVLACPLPELALLQSLGLLLQACLRS